MMDIQSTPVPEPMAAKKTPKKKAPARKSLAAAAAVVHTKPKRTYAPLIDLEQFSEQELAELMLAAGDAPKRKAYFDYSEESPSTRGGRKVYLDVGRDATMHDYRGLDGARTHRTMVTIPPKLRSQIQGVTGMETPMTTTAVVALASWACQELQRKKCRLVVTTASDELDETRWQVRKALVARARKKA